MPRAKRRKLEETHPESSKSLAAVPVSVTASLCGVPVEIKLIILEILVADSRGTLATVCQLSREWEEIATPLLYEDVLVARPRKGLQTLAQTVTTGHQPASFYKRTVKALCLWTSDSSDLDKESLPMLDAVLKVCCNINTLAIRYSLYSLGTILARHCTKLKKIIIPGGSLLDSKEKRLNARILALFSKNQITHLKLALPDNREIKLDLRSLAQLTHLHLESSGCFDVISFPDDLDLVTNRLALPPSIHVCVLTVGVDPYSASEAAAALDEAVASAAARHPALVFIATRTSPYEQSDGDSVRDEDSSDDDDEDDQEEEENENAVVSASALSVNPHFLNIMGYPEIKTEIEWPIGDLVPLIRDDRENFARTWLSWRLPETHSFWEVAERLVALRGAKGSGSA